MSASAPTDAGTNDTGWKIAQVGSQSTVRDAMEVLDRTGLRIALVTELNGLLLGIVTDGDVRRGILGRISVDDSVTTIMNSDPVVGRAQFNKAELLKIMQDHDLQSIPIVDDSNHVIALQTYRQLLAPTKLDNRVVILAGGIGRRLRPLTHDCPKPMLKIAGKPLLEWTIKSLVAQGFSKFDLSVSYQSEKIVNHFGDGSQLGANIDYITESKPLGTAGPLSLLGDSLDKPLILMNGDIVTRLNFSAALQFHHTQNAALTVCAKTYEFQVPFGVIEANGTHVAEIVEKPVHSWLVSGGIYILSPEAIRFLEPDTHRDMPCLIKQLIEAGERVATFPIYEDWVDVGRHSDLELVKAQADDLFGVHLDHGGQTKL